MADLGPRVIYLITVSTFHLTKSTDCGNPAVHSTNMTSALFSYTILGMYGSVLFKRFLCGMMELAGAVRRFLPIYNITVRVSCE